MTMMKVSLLAIIALASLSMISASIDYKRVHLVDISPRTSGGMLHSNTPSLLVAPDAISLTSNIWQQETTFCFGVICQPMTVPLPMIPCFNLWVAAQR
jgi:hypothetical protein